MNRGILGGYRVLIGVSCLFNDFLDVVWHSYIVYIPDKLLKFNVAFFVFSLVFPHFMGLTAVLSAVN